MACVGGVDGGGEVVSLSSSSTYCISAVRSSVVVGREVRSSGLFVLYSTYLLHLAASLTYFILGNIYICICESTGRLN